MDPLIETSTLRLKPGVLILRPIVTISKAGKDSEGASDAVQAGLHGALTRTFEDQGYTVRFDPGLIAQWEDTPPNDEPIKALQHHYDALLEGDTNAEGFFRGPDCAKVLKISLQDDLKKVANNNEFDLIVLARAKGNVTTKSDNFNPYGSPEYLHFSIGVLDETTGQMIYYCESKLTGKFGSSPDSTKYIESPESLLTGPIGKCLKHYFGGGTKHP